MLQIKKTPANMVIFGGYGDLAWRKLIPAFYNLYIHGFLPDQFAIYAVHYQPLSEAEFEKHMREGVDTFSRSGKTKSKEWNAFIKNLFYFQGDFTLKDTFTRLKTTLGKNDALWKTRGTRLFYYSVSPNFIKPISESIAQYQLASQIKHDRIIVEKPFGTDLSTAKALNRLLTQKFNEKQIYRIDHYLGKEVVQNILAFRFANYIFEPLWNKNYIDHIQISATESVSVGTRGSYYDKSGALRDMLQNHLMQLLSVIGMEAPNKYEAETIRNAKVKLLKKVRRYTPATVSSQVVRAQYTTGTIDEKKQVGYREEKDVDQHSVTETYVSAKLFIDNERWQGVPFFLRTGKCLEKQATVIVVQFKDSPQKIFKGDCNPNRLIISIQPEQEITLLFEGKVPGLTMDLRSLEMDFTYKEGFKEQAPEAYETLLLDALEGDATQFMRADQVEEAWKIVMPILDAWKKQGSKGLQHYAAGTWGPLASDRLIKKNGDEWRLLPHQEPQKYKIKCKKL